MADAVSQKVVDFTNVKDGGNFNKNRVPMGDYLAKVIKVQDAESKSDKTFQYLFTISLVNKYTDRKFPYYCKLQENQLWKLRNLLIAAGINVPKKRIKLDPTKVVGKLIGVTMEDDEYEGKAQSTIASIFPASELAEGVEADDEVDEAEEVDTDEDIEDDSDEDTAEGDEFDGMDRAELKAYLSGHDSDFKAKKSQSDDDLRELARAAAANSTDEDEDSDEDEEEEEAPAPAPKKKSKKAKAAEVSDEELEELDIDDI